MTPQEWLDLLLSPRDPAEVWEGIARNLAALAEAEDEPRRLEQATILPDRLLAEAAYPLWRYFAESAPRRSSERLIRTCTDHCAVLILDAFSIREMALIIREARKRGIPLSSDVTFSEAPSETNCFAQALGAPSRASLRDDNKSGNFKLFGGNCHTDVVKMPFADVPIPPRPNLVIWHSFLDDRIHDGYSGKEVHDMARREISGDGFWRLIEKLRQGRKVILTSDHGYAVAEWFSAEICDPQAVKILREQFKTQRYAQSELPREKFMPPFFVSNRDYCMVTGQRKWKAPSGFRKVCHGGLSLLEVASPWIEFKAVNS